MCSLLLTRPRATIRTAESTVKSCVNDGEAVKTRMCAIRAQASAAACVCPVGAALQYSRVQL